MAAGINFLFKPWCFLNQVRTSQFLSSRVISLLRQSSTASKVLSANEAARLENWRRRVDLAASYRIFERLNLHEGVCNHLSMMAPAASGEGQVMLIVPYGLHWSEVRHIFNGYSDTLAIVIFITYVALPFISDCRFRLKRRHLLA